MLLEVGKDAQETRAAPLKNKEGEIGFFITHALAASLVRYKKYFVYLEKRTRRKCGGFYIWSHQVDYSKLF